MKKFEAALDTVIKQFGKKIITEKRFVSVLADYNAFKDTPDIRNILNQCMKLGYMEELLKLNNKHSFLQSKNSKYQEISDCIEKYSSLIGTTYPNHLFVKNVIDAIAMRIVSGYVQISGEQINASSITNVPNPKTSTNKSIQTSSIIVPSSSNNSLTGGQYSKNNKYTLSWGFTDYFYCLVSLIILIAGNAIYLVSISGEWWMSVAFFVSLLIHLPLLSIGESVIKRKTSFIYTFIGECSFVPINLLMPLFLTFRSIEQFYCFFMDNYSWRFRTGYEGTIGGFVLLFFICLIFIAIMSSLLSSADLLPLKRKIINRLKPILLGGILTMLSFCGFFSIAGVRVIENINQQANIEKKVKIELQNNKEIVENRLREYMELSYKSYSVGSNINKDYLIAQKDTSINNLSKICIVQDIVDYSNNAVWAKYPLCEEFQFRSNVIDHDALVTVRAFDKIVCEINVDLGEYHYGIDSLYIKKYGEPTLSEEAIREKYDLLDISVSEILSDTLKWIYSNGVISLTNHIISYYDPVLLNKEKIYKEKIYNSTLKALEVQREQERLAKKKAETMERINKEAKQLNDI